MSSSDFASRFVRRLEQRCTLAVRFEEIVHFQALSVDQIDPSAGFEQHSRGIDHIVLHCDEQRRALGPVHRVNVTSLLDQFLQERRTLFVLPVVAEPMQETFIPRGHGGTDQSTGLVQQIEHLFVAVVHGEVNSKLNGVFDGRGESERLTGVSSTAVRNS